MFLVRLPDDQPAQWLFLHADPRTEGCPFPVLENVEYEDELPGLVKKGAEGAAGQFLGRAINNSHRFKRFYRLNDLANEGCEFLSGTAMELTRWSMLSTNGRGSDVLQYADGATKSNGGVLSEREAEVLKLIALGYSNKEIAAQMKLSIKTIETYKVRSIKKLGLKNRVEIVRYAARQGWFDEL
jgi:DNA-binding CsgD family transcriptional regulator